MPALTNYERLNLKNQFSPNCILNAQRIMTAMLRLIQNGYELEYEKFLGGHELYEGMSEADSREVLEILDMFWDLEGGFNQLKDKTGIDESTVKYKGFDGNNENDQMGYANYYITDLFRFSGLNPLNSHRPMLKTYRRMLTAYSEFSNRDLTREGIVKVTAIAAQPSVT